MAVCHFEKKRAHESLARGITRDGEADWANRELECSVKIKADFNSWWQSGLIQLLVQLKESETLQDNKASHQVGAENVGGESVASEIAQQAITLGCQLKVMDFLRLDPLHSQECETISEFNLLLP